MPTHLPVDARALDQLLLAVPVHVLYFDGGLICRYAAPTGPHFLGRTADELLETPAHVIFPAELALEPPLRQVLETRRLWTGEHVPYPAGPGGAWPAGVWDIQMQPWTLLEQTMDAGAARTNAEGVRPVQRAGVLVSCLPCGESAPPAAPDPTQQLLREGERAAVLLERIRTQLTVVRGFAGLLRRRALASGTLDPAARRIDEAAATLARLLEDYEAATQLAIRHPDDRRG